MEQFALAEFQGDYADESSLITRRGGLDDIVR